ncbi:MAG: dTDP-4-dehydrorhamnose 3,5-epimerase [Proteobacteria bacterium]|nr:dTDP-4-dehydrorhamnose 3,5-epimerase [Pseudomonadota bacterium]
MGFIKTGLDGVLIFEPKVHKDPRGYFFESYSQKLFAEHDLHYNFVQDNQSKSKYGVLRGLHYQLGPHAQTKLVRVLKGKIWDVIVDVRRNSSKYKKWIAFELTDEDFKQVLIPKGFAHGFIVLSEEAIVSYKCDTFYDKSSEGGIKFDDPELNIDWKIPHKDIIISDKDLKNPYLKDARDSL